MAASQVAPGESNGNAPAPAEQPEQQVPGEVQAAPETAVPTQLPPPAGSKGCRIVERYADLVADYPGAVFCVVLGVLCLFILMCGAVAATSSSDAIVIDFSLDSMKTRGDDIADRDEALDAAWCGGPCSDDDRRLRRRLDDRGLSSYWNYWNTMTVAYVNKAGDGSNVLTESLLPQVLELERSAADVLGEPSYTVLPSLFPAYPSSSGMKTGDALQDELRELAMLSTSDADTGRYWPSFDMNFTECGLSSSLVTSTFYGEPSVWLDIYSDVLPNIETDDLYLTFFWGNDDEPEVFAIERDDLISRDMFLLAGVVMMVMFLLVVQTRSVFLSCGGMLAILLAMVVALCIYRTFVTNWFGLLNAASIFLLLGIACDDIFVIADGWRLTTESAGFAPDDYKGRLRYMLPRAGGAVTTTSLTTAGAFFGNLISIITPTRLFGVFSGCLVLADLALTVFLLPAVLVLQHKWFGGTWCEHRNGAGPSEPRTLDKLLARWFAPCVLRFAPVLLVFMAALAAVSFNVALEMKPAAEWHNSDLLPSSYNQPRAYRAQQAMRNLEPEYAWLHLVYGVIPEDTGDMNDPKSKSDVSWGTPVDIAAPAVQEFVLDLCNELLSKRGLARRVATCWAQKAEQRAIEQGIDFPIQDASIFWNYWWLNDGVHQMSDGSGYWFTIDVELTLLSDETVSATREAYDEWEALMDSWNNEAKQRGLQSLSQGFQYSGRWRFMSTVEAMANTAFTACCISSLIAAVLLLVTLQNVVMALVIISNVAAICLALVACFVIEGRGLGVLEGIAMTLIVGLSVDYLVHVARAYIDTDKGMPRGQRTLHAMAHLGGSVCVAAVTTILSAAFLCMGTITFFTAFGAFVIGMMVFALMFTFFSLVPFLHLFGPEGGCGDVRCQKVCGSDMPHSEQTEAASLTSGVQVSSFRASTRLATITAAVLVLLVGGAVQIAISVGGDSESSATCEALTELEFTFEQFTIPAEYDSYRCRDYDLIPATCTYYVTGWEPIIADGSASFVHHMILFSTNRAGSQCTFTCFDMPDMIGIDAAWAVGGGDTTFPDGMALAIGGTKHALQMHYNNVALQSGVVDTRSGIRLKLSQTPPTKHITVMMTGLHPRGDLNIPPYETNMTVLVECDIGNKLRGDVRAIAYNNHAHKLGFRITTELRRPTSPGSFSTDAIGDVGNDISYDFNYQRTTLFEESEYRTIQPGDSLRIYCSYNSMSRTFTTFSGFGSEDEMCLTSLYLEPAENVLDTGCWTNSAERVN